MGDWHKPKEESPDDKKSDPEEAGSGLEPEVGWGEKRPPKCNMSAVFRGFQKYRLSRTLEAWDKSGCCYLGVKGKSNDQGWNLESVSISRLL